MVRDLINQIKTSTNPDYCVRVTANDGALGEKHLREFQDNEKTIPTILITSQKLSTGVDDVIVNDLAGRADYFKTIIRKIVVPESQADYVLATLDKEDINDAILMPTMDMVGATIHSRWSRERRHF